MVFTLEVPRLDMAVAGAKPNVAFGAAHGNAAVTGIDIDVTRDLVGTDRTIAGVNLHAAVQAFHGHRAVTGADGKVGILRHVDFNLEAAIFRAQGETPVPLHSRVDLDAVAVLARIDV